MKFKKQKKSKNGSRTFVGVTLFFLLNSCVRYHPFIFNFLTNEIYIFIWHRVFAHQKPTPIFFRHIFSLLFCLFHHTVCEFFCSCIHEKDAQMKHMLFAVLRVQHRKCIFSHYVATSSCWCELWPNSITLAAFVRQKQHQTYPELKSRKQTHFVLFTDSFCRRSPCWASYGQMRKKHYTTWKSKKTKTSEKQKKRMRHNIRLKRAKFERKSHFIMNVCESRTTLSVSDRF